MFAATETLTLNSVDYDLIRVNQDNYGSEYRYLSDTESINLKIRNSTDSVDGDGVVMLRHNVYVEYIVFPTATDLMKKYTFTGTFRNGQYSGTTACGYLAAGVMDWLGTSTNLTDIIAGAN